MAEFQLTEKEFVRASLRVAFKRPLRGLILCSLAFALFAYSQFAAGRSWQAAVFGFAIGAAVFPAILYFISARRLKKAFREQESFQLPVNLTLDEAQLHYSFPGGTYAMPWSAVRRWKETGEFILLFESDLFARILPKRALSNEETALVREKMAALPQV